MPWTLHVARFAAPGVALWTLFQTLLVVLRDQLHLARAFFFRRRVVVCGIGDMGSAMVLSYRAQGRSVVAIEQLEDSPLARQCREAGAVVVVGDATDPAVLIHAGIHRAQEVILTCGNDAINAQVANLVEKLAEPRLPGDHVCAQHVVDPYLWRELVRQPRHNERGFRRVFFNLYDSGARAMLAQYPFPSDAARQPRLVIVGLGRLGESLAMRAARRWRDRRQPGAEPLTITIVDREAARKCELLQLHFPGVREVARLEPVQTDVRSPQFESLAFLGSAAYDELGIFVCMDDETVSLTAARLVRQAGVAANVVVRIHRPNGLVELFGTAAAGSAGSESLQLFSLLGSTCTPEVVHGGASIETLARLIHEAYVDQQRSLGYTPESNPSMAAWDDLPDGLRESNRDQARHVPEKLAAIGRWFVVSPEWDIVNDQLKPDEVEMLAVMEHDRWVKERRAQDWRWGPERDPENKISPYLVPWDEMPSADEHGNDVRDYDRDTVRRLPEFLARAGFRMQRL
jgi:predicted dinucleotide-binding enzyme